MSNHRQSLVHSESGQAAVLVAFVLFLGFLAFAALAIDGAMTYLVRRDLQNVADSAVLAACRVIANNDTSGGDVTTTALNAAENAITAHLGSWAPYASPNVGTGVGLVKGIEVSGPQVRVALQRRVPTVLTQFVGRSDSIMIAQARCDARAGGGPLPIAVQRYDGGLGRSQRDYLANKAASGYPPGAPVYQYGDPAYAYTVTVPGRYYPPGYDIPVPKPAFEASDGGVNDPNTGPEVALLGQQALSNNTPNDMSGFIMLDIRNVGSVNAIEYYNGMEGQANTFKDVSQNYIYMHGYPGPFPQVQSEVAVLAGVSAAFSPHAIVAAGYQIGDIVPVIVYDGFVWSAPDFAFTITPQAPNSNGISAGFPNSAATAVSYSASIAAANKWPPGTSLNFNVKLWFSGKDDAPVSPPPGTHIMYNGQDLMSSGMSFLVNNVTDSSPWTGNLLIYSDSAGPAITQTQTYLGGLNFMITASSGLINGASTNYGFGALPSNYTVRTESGGAVIRQSDSNTVSALTFGDSAVSGQCAAVATANLWNASGTTQLTWDTASWNIYFSSSQTANVKIKKDTLKSADFTLAATGTIDVGSYILRVTVPSTSCGPQHSVDIPITIGSPVTAPTTKQFVFIQGFALFRISNMLPTAASPNTIMGYAISKLYFDYNDVIQGRLPRLMPWN